MNLFFAFGAALLLFPCISGTPACTSVAFDGVVYETDGLWNITNQIYIYKFQFDISNDPSNATFPNFIHVQILLSNSSDPSLYTSSTDLYFIINTPDGTSNETISCFGAINYCNVSSTNGLAANTFKLNVPGGFISMDDVTGLSVNNGQFYDGSNQIAFNQLNQNLTGNSDTISAQHYYRYSQSARCTAVTDFEDPTTQAPPAPTDDPSAIGTACSTDSSLAWLDVIFVIDTSSSMTNIGDLTLTIASLMTFFPVGQNANHTTRVAIIKFGTHANVVTVLANTTNFDDFRNILNTLQANPSDVGGGIQEGLQTAWDMIQAQKTYRRPVVVLASAAYNAQAFENAITTATLMKGDGISIVVLNYAIVGGVVTDTLKNISSPGYYYLSNQNGILESMTYGFTQINCFCNVTTVQLAISYPQWGNQTKYADCFRGVPDEAVAALAEYGCVGGNLVSFTTHEKFDFVIDNLFTSNGSYIAPMAGKKQFITGLHTNSNGDWVWWGYNGTEIPYTGYPPLINPSAPGDKYGAMTVSGFNWGMKTASTFQAPYVCQTRACDASYIC